MAVEAKQYKNRKHHSNGSAGNAKSRHENFTSYHVFFLLFIKKINQYSFILCVYSCVFSDQCVVRLNMSSL